MDYVLRNRRLTTSLWCWHAAISFEDVNYLLAPQAPMALLALSRGERSKVTGSQGQSSRRGQDWCRFWSECLRDHSLTGYVKTTV